MSGLGTTGHNFGRSGSGDEQWLAGRADGLRCDAMCRRERLLLVCHAIGDA